MTTGALPIRPLGDREACGSGRYARQIAERVGKRNFMEEARSADLVGGGPPPFNDRDRQRFANTLDRVITAQKRR